MSHGRSEPAELHRLRKQVKEAKEGPLEFRREKAKRQALKKKVKGQREKERERTLGPQSLGLSRVVILGEVPGENLRRFINFPGVSF